MFVKVKLPVLTEKKIAIIIADIKDCIIFIVKVKK